MRNIRLIIEVYSIIIAIIKMYQAVPIVNDYLV